MPLAAGASIGSYEIIAPLGAGGMGEVYRARDTKLKREVAIKVLPADVANDRERLARFRREAELLASLNHPHIAHVYGIEDNALVMELVEGEDLSQRIARGPVPLDEALPIANQIAEALEAAHEMGIVHRDLKPANIKVRGDGTVKVLDFGLAKGSAITDHESKDPVNSPTLTSPAMTMRGVILGTAAYMAPEQAKGKAVDQRADIWAFGCVLYEMLTGSRAFKGDDVTDIITSVMRDKPDGNALPPTTPLAIRTLLRRCLEKDPHKRAPHIGIARLEIDDAITANGERLDVPGARRGLSYAVVAAIAMAGMVLAGGAGWTLRRPADAPLRPILKASWPFNDLDTGVARLAVQRNLIAVSRNGRTMAVIASNVMFRRTDQLTWTEIANTRDASSVFVSPDGEWVGIVSRTGMAKVRATGGVPTVILSLKDTSTFGASDATWADDNRIYFVDRNGVFAISADGGEPQAIDGGPEYGSIDVLPGSRDLLLTRGRAQAIPSIVLRSLDGRQDTLVTDALDAKFVAPDVLLFVRRGTLMGVRLDLAARRITGDPVALVQDVAVLSTQSQYAVTDDGLLAYLPASFDTAGQSRLRVRTPKGALKSLSESVRRHSDPRLSPDGRKLALHIFEQEDDIWVLDLARLTLTRLTFDPREDETPVWSPDGQWIAFAGFARGGDQRAVLRRRADGSGAEEALWTGADHSHVTDWSPDGRTVLMELTHPRQRSDLLAIDVQERKARPLMETPFNEAGARLSPDGKWLVYQSDESGRYEIYVVAFPGLDRKIQVSTQGGEQPVWAGDGRAIYFRTEKEIARAAVDVKGAVLSVGIPVSLFPDTFLRPQAVNHTTIDVTADGGVVVLERLNTSPRPPEVIGMFNWVDDVKRKLGSR